MVFAWLLVEFYFIGAFICAILVFSACRMSARVTDQELRFMLFQKRLTTVGALQNRAKRPTAVMPSAR